MNTLFPQKVYRKNKSSRRPQRKLLYKSSEVGSIAHINRKIWDHLDGKDLISLLEAESNEIENLEINFSQNLKCSLIFSDAVLSISQYRLRKLVALHIHFCSIESL